ncbi:hypothetical protein DSO57_1021513 [Entomophthora muscae]|uniref:Uncharacterized protein n=1 Tax=Entomophthora muscae TaxID=34485 RepID=A0ACC2RUF2_9FUNG|nr:hypothetical protein DSO57_1021513 [Entomophthora muscae]
MNLSLWTPLVSSRLTLNLANYVILLVTLLYLAGNLWQYNALTKVFGQEINLYSIVYALNGFQLPNLPSYVTKVLPSTLGYYNTKELIWYNRKGLWFTTEPQVFKDRYNSRHAYQLDMELPLTPKMMPLFASELPLDNFNKLFGIFNITLSGVIETIIPASGLWSWVGTSMLYNQFYVGLFLPGQSHKTTGRLPKAGSLTPLPKEILINILYKLRDFIHLWLSRILPYCIIAHLYLQLLTTRTTLGSDDNSTQATKEVYSYYFCPPGESFSHLHFNEYPTNPKSQTVVS